MEQTRQRREEPYAIRMDDQAGTGQPSRTMLDGALALATAAP
jgi:hypothetical protein